MAEPADELPPPEVAACDRPPDQVPPASSYRPRDSVWVYRHETGWHLGVVIGSGPLAVMVRYRLTRELGEMTDTVMPEYLAARAQPKPTHRNGDQS
jgi:hypothetical protein